MARVFVLNDLFVQAQARKAGVASSLLAAAADAKAFGAVRLTPTTNIDNTVAQSVYAAQGYKRDQEFFDSSPCASQPCLQAPANLHAGCCG